MEFELFIFVQLLLIVVVSSMKLKQTNPSIIWSTDNKLFKSNDHLVINVKIGEFLNIICPRYDMTRLETSDDTSASLEFNSIYMVTKQEYNECKLDSNLNSHRLLLKCDKPFDSLKYTLYISKYSPVPDAIEFDENKDYYLVSTSDGTLNGLNNTFKGTCHTNKMKLIIRVSDSKSIHNHAHNQQMTKSNQYLKRFTSSIIKSTTPISTTTTTTTRRSTTTSTTTGMNFFRPSNDIFILEPSDNSNDYSDLLQQLITNSNNNSENDIDRKQVSSSAVLVSHSIRLVSNQFCFYLLVITLYFLFK